MGCLSSKVGQLPCEPAPGEDVSGKALTAKNVEHSLPDVEAEEPRPAAPVDARERSTPAASIPLEPQRHDPHESARSCAGREEAGVEGQTITDESGLQMRTPRRLSEDSLHSAAKSGDLALLRSLLGARSARTGIESPGNADSPVEKRSEQVPPDATGSSPMLDMDERGMWGNTPLLVAVQYGHAHVALALIEGGADVCTVNERGATALHYACAEGLFKVSRELLSRGARVDPSAAVVHHPAIAGGRSTLLTPLTAAASAGNVELVRLLIEYGADVNQKATRREARKEKGAPRREAVEAGTGATPLTSAARVGHSDTCRLLIDSGAQISQQDDDGRTPLMNAIHGRHSQTAIALLDATRAHGRARSLASTRERLAGEEGAGHAPLTLACRERLHDVVQEVLAAGADVSAVNSSGETPLLVACLRGCLTCVRALLLRAADPLAQDHTGNTPLSIATSRARGGSQEQEILSLIEAAVASVSEKSAQTREASAERMSLCVSDASCVDLAGDALSVEDVEDLDEDVLRVSDWQDEDLHLQDYEVWGTGGFPVSSRRDGEARDVGSDCGSREIGADDQADEEDVLLVDDYEVELAGEDVVFEGSAMRDTPLDEAQLRSSDGAGCSLGDDSSGGNLVGVNAVRPEEKDEQALGGDTTGAPARHEKFTICRTDEGPPAQTCPKIEGGSSIDREVTVLKVVTQTVISFLAIAIETVAAQMDVKAAGGNGQSDAR